MSAPYEPMRGYPPPIDIDQSRTDAELRAKYRDVFRDRTDAELRAIIRAAQQTLSERRKDSP